MKFYRNMSPEERSSFKFVIAVFLIGVLAAALRLRGIEEAIVYSVIVGNMAAPLIERITVPRAFGQKKMVRVHNDKNDSAA